MREDSPGDSLSFVIPAYNEAEGIHRCVTSIVACAPASMDHEILVVDNGSEDETASIAARAGAKVIASEAATIGGVRNDGVKASRGTILVFLDADCALTPGWAAEFEQLIAKLEEDRLWCAGSQVIPPPSDPVFLWKYWFIPFSTQASASHVGSAHMIFHRDGFLSVGGFDEVLETGEDFELCSRVHRGGGSVLNVPELRVEHYGFPRTWKAFFRRERWHGKGDATSVRAVLSSRVAVTSILFVLSIVAGVVAIAVGWSGVGFVALGGAALLLAAASMVKFRHAGIRVQLASLAILPVYFLARTVSVVDSLTRGTRSAS